MISKRSSHASHSVPSRTTAAWTHFSTLPSSSSSWEISAGREGQNSSALSTLINRPQAVGASCSHLLPSCAPCFVQERPRIVEPSLQGLPCARSHSSRNTRVKKKTTRPHRVLLCPAWPRSEKFTQELQQKQSPERCKPDVREPDATQGRDPHGLTTTTAC